MTAAILGVVSIVFGATYFFHIRLPFAIAGIVVLIPLLYWWMGKILIKAKRTLLSQGRFNSNLAHELRRPLSVMQLMSELALEDTNTKKLSKEKSQELVEILTADLEGLKTMANIIKNLSLMASYEYGPQQIELTRVNLSLLLERLCKTISTQFADDKKIKIHADVSAPIYVSGNESALEQMIVNLLRNAVTYTPKKGTIIASLTAFPEKTVMSIKDNGVGIAPKDLPYVLNPFYRAQSGEAAKERGTGLGLAIVAEIVKQHKAKIVINSILTKGTEVSVSFPATN